MTSDPSWHWFLGRLDWSSISILRAIQDPTASELVGAGAAMAVVLGGIGVVALITWLGAWRTLWTDWLTSVDHKRIGIMYVVLSVVMLARGVAEGVVMRAQQAAGPDGGFLSSSHFGELFSTHGTIMLFFVAMPFLAGLINYVLPLQIGARDMSFPMLISSASR